MGLDDRLSKLEDRHGPEPCPRCSGYWAVRVNERLESVSRNGEAVAPGVWGEVEAGMVGGRCPECGRTPFTIRPRGLFEPTPKGDAV